MPITPNHLAPLKLLAMDVDGVLTDGAMYVADDGSRMRRFHAHDGQGIKYLMAAGIEVAWISKDDAPATRHRAATLGVSRLLQGVRDKAAALQGLIDELGLRTEQVAFIGDDLPDLAAFGVAGVSFAPRDAVPAVRAVADHVCGAGGGQGAVREVCDLILQAVGDDNR